MTGREERMLFAGADPGTTGGLVVLDATGRYVDSLRLDHDDGSGIRDWLEKHREDIALAIVEEVNSMPTDGGIQAFEFGRQFERITQTLVCLRIPFQTARPAKWQASAGISKPAPIAVGELADHLGALDESDARIAALSPEARAELRATKRAASAKRKSKVNLKRAIAEQARQRWPQLPIRIIKDWALADAAFMADHARRLHQGEAIQKATRKRVAAQEAT